MRKKKHISVYVGMISLSCILLPGLLRILDGDILSLDDTLVDISLACLVMMMVPRTKTEMIASPVAASLVCIASLFISGFDDQLCDLRLLLYSLSIALPCTMCTIGVYRRSSVEKGILPPVNAAYAHLDRFFLESALLLVSFPLYVMLGVGNQSVWLLLFFLMALVSLLVISFRICLSDTLTSPRGASFVAGSLPSKKSWKDISVAEVFTRIEKVMRQEQLYLRSNLDVEAVSKAVGSNRNYVSLAIKEFAQTNFNQYVNNYRVEYAQGLFKEDTSLKVKDLSDLSGFNSTVTFNLAFKLVTGYSPSYWCQLYKDSLSARKPLSTSRGQGP